MPDLGLAKKITLKLMVLFFLALDEQRNVTVGGVNTRD